MSRRISIEQQLTSKEVEPDYCEAIIVIDLEDLEKSYIELSSTLSGEAIGKTDVYPLKYQDPKDLIGAITEELAEIGFEMDNVQIQADDKLYPIEFFLKYEDDIDVATNVANFLDNPDLGDK